MKKIWALVFSFLMLLGLVGCDSSTRRVEVVGLIYADSLQLNFIKKATVGGDHITFFSELTLENIKEKVDKIKLKDGTIESEIINSNFLLIEKKLSSDRVSYYLIADITKDNDTNKRHYHFSTASAYFYAGESNSREDYYIHIPHHLFSLKKEVNTYFQIETNTPYEATGSKEAIIEFYNKIAIYSVTKNKDSIDVEIKDNLEILGRHTKKSFSIGFVEINGSLFAIYQQ